MPGPTYGLSRKEVKKARKILRRKGKRPAAAAQQVVSRRSPNLKRDFTPGFRRLVRTEIKDVKDARRQLRRLGVSLDTFSGSLSPGEAEFVAEVAKGTGLDKRVVAAWTRLEGGNSTGDYNRLNIGHTDSGPLGFTSDSVWANPKSAARETIAFLKGQKYGASPQIQQILPRARGKSPQQQIAVITSSGWATDPQYAQKVASVYSQLGASDGPGNSPQAQRARTKLNTAKENLRELGALRMVAKPKKVSTIVQIGRIAQNRFGLRVAEHPEFDQVDPVHTEGSYHYSNAAIDVTGDPAKLLAFDKFVARRFGKDLEELFYDPGVNIDSGQVVGPIGGHGGHVHVAETTGASAGLSGPFPSGSMTPSASAGTGSASAADTEPLTAAERRIRRRVRNIRNRPLARTTTSSPSGDLSSTGVSRSVSALAKKYGVGL